MFCCITFTHLACSTLHSKHFETRLAMPIYTEKDNFWKCAYTFIQLCTVNCWMGGNYNSVWVQVNNCCRTFWCPWRCRCTWGCSGWCRWWRQYSGIYKMKWKGNDRNSHNKNTAIAWIIIKALNFHGTKLLQLFGTEWWGSGRKQPRSCRETVRCRR